MALLINNREVESVLDMTTLAHALEQALIDEHDGAVHEPPRLNLFRDSGFMRIGAVWLERAGLVGFKAFNGSRKLGVRYAVLLYSTRSGELRAIIDSSSLTAARTGAASAVATKHLAAPAASRLAVIGSGLEAWMNTLGVLAVRAIESVTVFSPREHRRTAFADRVRHELGVAASACADAPGALAGADTVVIATNTGAGGPTAFSSDWIEAGMHVNAIGSTMPSLREIDEQTFARADITVVDTLAGVQAESGDVQHAQAAGTYPARVIQLSELVATGSPTRHAEAVTLFKSVGTALQDVVAAQVVYEASLARGLGMELGDFPERKVE